MKRPSEYMTMTDGVTQRDYINALNKYIDFLENEKSKQFSLQSVVKSLPTKEEIISEGEKQIIDWLEGNTEREKKHYRIGFRRSFEYVLRRLR